LSKPNYGTIQKTVKALKESGMSDKAIKEVLKWYV